jgi:diguanylate cyclase (GGDEF)-like protein
MRALEEMVHVDSLTKLFNRRHFDLALEREIARAQRQQLPLSLVMVDVDRFKSVNDAYGHVSGDEVLCHVAEIMRASARKSDVLARYGGEEFVLILVGTPSDRARQVAERVRKAVEDQPVRLGAKGSIPVTISLGVADYDGAEAPLALIERADAALYRAKAGGRNQVAV